MISKDFMYKRSKIRLQHTINKIRKNLKIQWQINSEGGLNFPRL